MRRRIGVLAAVVTVFSALVQYVPSIVINRWANEGLPTWLPTLDSLGMTVWLYTSINGVVAPLLTALLAVGVGYYAGRRADVAREHRRFVGTVALGSVLSVVAGLGLLGLAGLAASGMPSIDGSFVLQVVGLVLQALANASLPVVLGVFAGAALAHFETDRARPRRPTETGIDGHSSANSESESTPADTETRPTR